MTDWTIRDDEQGEPVEVAHGHVVVRLESGGMFDSYEVQALIRQARADRDAQWLAWIEEELDLIGPLQHRTKDRILHVESLTRLRARVEGK